VVTVGAQTPADSAPFVLTGVPLCTLNLANAQSGCNVGISYFLIIWADTNPVIFKITFHFHLY
jgi:hypothetical protein